MQRPLRPRLDEFSLPCGGGFPDTPHTCGDRQDDSADGKVGMAILRLRVRLLSLYSWTRYRPPAYMRGIYADRAAWRRHPLPRDCCDGDGSICGSLPLVWDVHLPRRGSSRPHDSLGEALPASIPRFCGVCRLGHRIELAPRHEDVLSGARDARTFGTSPLQRLLYEIPLQANEAFSRIQYGDAGPRLLASVFRTRQVLVTSQYVYHVIVNMSKKANEAPASIERSNSKLFVFPFNSIMLPDIPISYGR